MEIIGRAGERPRGSKDSDAAGRAEKIMIAMRRIDELSWRTGGFEREMLMFWSVANEKCPDLAMQFREYGRRGR